MGTLLLRIFGNEPEIEIDALILDDPSSLDVYNRLALGVAFDSTAPPDLEPASYLAAIAHEGPADLRAGLEQVLPWLGEQICEPLTGWLEDLGCLGVTLVPCGPISSAPLGAAPWDEDGAEHCLLDVVSVRYAPSALVAARSRSRGSEGIVSLDCWPLRIRIAASTQPNLR